MNPVTVKTTRKIDKKSYRMPYIYKDLPEHLQVQTWNSFRENWGLLSYLHTRKPFLIILGFWYALAIGSMTLPSNSTGISLDGEFFSMLILMYIFALLCYVPYKIVVFFLTKYLAKKTAGISSYKDARFVVRDIRRYLKNMRGKRKK